MARRSLTTALVAAVLIGCEANVSDQPTPPVAERRPWSQTVHGVTLDDPYHWLADESYPEVDDPDVLAYLKAENAYFEAVMAPRQPLVEALFAEIKARQEEDEAGVPTKEGGYYYQWRYEPGGQYRIWSRWPAGDADAAAGPTAAAQVILDEPALAKDAEYFRLGALAVSNNGRLLAYSTDTSGAERYTLRVKDIASDALLADVIEDTQGDPVWTADDAAFFYTRLDDEWRPYQVRLHTLGAPAAEDRVVYTEEDAGFFVGVSRTASKRYVVVGTGDHVTSEARLIPADAPTRPPLLVAPRRAEHEYTVDHQGHRFVIKTNDTHKNARLVVAPDDDPSPAAWRPLVPASDTRYLLDYQVFRDFVAVAERIDGVDHIRLLGAGAGAGGGEDAEGARIAFPEDARAVGFGENEEFDARTVRLRYTSLVTPRTVYDYDVDAAVLHTRKVQRIPSGYDRAAYVTERITAPARDGAGVPVSIVHKRGVPRDGSAPLYLYAYGAYGHATMPRFSATRLSLLERGFVFAIAHVRGGDELGYHWYEAGKREHRANTFNDFVDVARHLVAQGFATAGRIAIAGGSAGGELMGAAVNQAPELWGAVAAHVPFVDVLNTMLNASLPLTPIEWPEWGNPIEDKAAFDLIRSYSPYDQLKAGRYPPMLVTAGLSDPRVTYWEPAKYVAKLRTLKTGETPLLLKTNMSAGHGGKSGRFDSLREVAEEYAFVLWALGEEDDTQQ